MSKFFTLSQVLGAFEHNRATTEEGRINQDERINEQLTNAAMNWGFARLFRVSFDFVNQAAKLAKNRISYIKSFKGFREDYIPYVDVTEKVFTREYKKGTVLYQYQTEEGALGSFFVASTKTTPEQVGLLSRDYPRLLKIELQEDVKVLVTKHVKGAKYWRDNQTITEGGGEQLFTRDISTKNAIITEIKKQITP